MKKIVLLLVLTVFFTSCGQNTKKEVSTATNKVAQKAVQQKTTIERLDTKSFYERVNGKDVQLVDVRTPQEYAAGHLKNADNVNVFDADFITKMAKYKKDEPVYVYCRSGGRSMKAANMLKTKGYHVVNLNGGFNGWASQGLPSEK